MEFGTCAGRGVPADATPESPQPVGARASGDFYKASATLSAFATERVPELTARLDQRLARPVQKPGMKSPHKLEYGKARYAILLWLLGIPLPIILLIWLIKGCV